MSHEVCQQAVVRVGRRRRPVEAKKLLQLAELDGLLELFDAADSCTLSPSSALADARSLSTRIIGSSGFPPFLRFQSALASSSMEMSRFSCSMEARKRATYSVSFSSSEPTRLVVIGADLGRRRDGRHQLPT